MSISNYGTPKKFTGLIAWLAHPATSWEKEDINPSTLDKLIKDFMRLIVGQTENPKTAPKLQQSLFDLSKRMEKEHTFNSPQGHHLAFEVTTIAMGIFTKPEDPQKPEWTKLPPEVLRIIFSKNPPKNSRRSELEESSDVSKVWKKNAEIVSKDWIDQEVIPLSNYGCKTAEEAVQYVIDNNLPSANLKDFPDLTNDQLTKLIENCPRIVHLILDRDRLFTINEFPLGKLTNLKTLSLSKCYINFSEGVLSECLKKLQHLTFLNVPCNTEIESLKELTKLTHLGLSGEYTIPVDKLLETLKNLTELTSLDLSDCDQISGANLVELVKNLTKLTSLNLSNNSNSKNKGDGMAEATKHLPKLTDLNLRFCIYFVEDRLAEALKNLPNLIRLNLSMCSMKNEAAEALQNLSQLTHLDLSYCEITEVRLEQLLKKLPKLKELNLMHCKRIEIKSIDKWKKQYPNIIFIH